jgi:leader peptidase (prepilin peptidase) / N-methyltransferase
MIRIFGTVFAALAGLAFGSFLNVCVTRWPEGESVVRPRSHCRSCDHMLAWWENIPLVSWLVLRGRCRACREWIGWRYPIVEAAVGAGWGLIASSSIPNSGLVPSGVSWAVGITVAISGGSILLMIFIWLLVALAVLDFENFWLPDKLTLPGIAIGLLIAAADTFAAHRLFSVTGLPVPEGIEEAPFGFWTPFFHRLIAVAVAAGFLLLIRWLYWLFRRRQGLGLGDVKLMAMIAAWLGLSEAALALVIAALLGTLAALALLIASVRRRESAAKWATTPLPFGTFLSIGGIVSSLWGAQMVAAYMRWAGF